MEFYNTSYRVIALCYFYCPETNLITTKWNLIKLHTMVEHNERIAVYNNHNSKLANYRIIALCNFSCLENNFKTTSWNSLKLHMMIQRIERKCGVQITELLSFVIFSFPENYFKTTRWNLIKRHEDTTH